MKATKLICGGDSMPLDMTGLIMVNSLHEIDRLEDVVNDLQKQVDYYEGIFQKLRGFARCDRFSYGPFINISNIYESDYEVLFADLMELLQLEEPEESEGKEEDEKNE